MSTRVFYDADFLDHLYDLVKQDLHQQHPSLANLPATSRLITKMNLKGDDLPRMWHTAEGDCVLMDCMDLVWPTLEAVSAIQAGIGQPRHLEGAASTVNPLILLGRALWFSNTRVFRSPRPCSISTCAPSSLLLTPASITPVLDLD
jgi:hypothetical protein